MKSLSCISINFFKYTLQHTHPLGFEMSDEDVSAFLEVLQSMENKGVDEVPVKFYRNWVTAKGQFGNPVTGIRQACWITR